MVFAYIVVLGVNHQSRIDRLEDILALAVQVFFAQSPEAEVLTKTLHTSASGKAVELAVSLASQCSELHLRASRQSLVLPNR